MFYRVEIRTPGLSSFFIYEGIKNMPLEWVSYLRFFSYLSPHPSHRNTCFEVRGKVLQYIPNNVSLSPPHIDSLCFETNSFTCNRLSVIIQEGLLEKSV